MCSDSVSLNYEDISYNQDNDVVKIGLVYDGDCEYFNISVIKESDIVDGNYNKSRNPVRVSSYAQEIQTSLTEQSLGSSSELKFFNIIAIDNNGSICSNQDTQQSFYHINPTGEQ